MIDQQYQNWDIAFLSTAPSSTKKAALSSIVKDYSLNECLRAFLKILDKLNNGNIPSFISSLQYLFYAEYNSLLDIFSEEILDKLVNILLECIKCENTNLSVNAIKALNLFFSKFEASGGLIESLLEVIHGNAALVTKRHSAVLYCSLLVKKFGVKLAEEKMVEHFPFGFNAFDMEIAYVTLCAYECLLKSYARTEISSNLTKCVIDLMDQIFSTADSLSLVSANTPMKLKCLDLLEFFAQLNVKVFTYSSVCIEVLLMYFSMKQNTVCHKLNNVVKQYLVTDPAFCMVALHHKEFMAKPEVLSVCVDYIDKIYLLESFDAIIEISFNKLTNSYVASLLFRLYELSPKRFQDLLIKKLLDKNNLSFSKAFDFYFLEKHNNNQELLDFILNNSKVDLVVKLILINSKKVKNINFLKSGCFYPDSETRIQCLEYLFDSCDSVNDFEVFNDVFFKSVNSLFATVRNQNVEDRIVGLCLKYYNHLNCSSQLLLQKILENVSDKVSNSFRIILVLKLCLNIPALFLSKENLLLIANSWLTNSYEEIRELSFQVLLKYKEVVCNVNETDFIHLHNENQKYHPLCSEGYCMLKYSLRKFDVNFLISCWDESLNIQVESIDVLIVNLVSQPLDTNLLTVLRLLQLIVEFEILNDSAIDDIINLCLKTNSLLAQFLSVDAPEGYDVLDVFESENVENNEVMGFAWRAMKAACVLLETIFSRFGLKFSRRSDICGHFIFLMFNTKHLGAYSSVESVFFKYCCFLLENEGFDELFGKLTFALNAVENNNNLMLTRRSGGIPLCIQALVKASITKKEYRIIHFTVCKLLDNVFKDKEGLVVHSLNILRFIVRDGVLFVKIENNLLDRIFRMVLLHRDSFQNWRICNSLNLLYSEIVSKLTSVPVTFESLLKRFPSLVEYIRLSDETGPNYLESFSLFLLLVKNFYSSGVSCISQKVLNCLVINCFQNRKARIRQLCAYGILNLLKQCMTIPDVVNECNLIFERFSFLDLNAFHGYVQIVYYATLYFGLKLDKRLISQVELMKMFLTKDCFAQNYLRGLLESLLTFEKIGTNDLDLKSSKLGKLSKSLNLLYKEDFVQFVFIVRKYSNMKAPVDEREIALNSLITYLGLHDNIWDFIKSKCYNDEFLQAFVYLIYEVISVNFLNDDDYDIRRKTSIFLTKAFGLKGNDEVEEEFLECVGSNLCHFKRFNEYVLKIKVEITETLSAFETEHAVNYEKVFSKERPNMFIEVPLLLDRFFK